MSQSFSQRARVTGGFWAPRLRLNQEQAIFHQWDKLQETLSINNFSLAAGEGEGFREGFFFSDSDAYKWLDAASRMLGADSSQQLPELVRAFISLITKAQLEDGYLNTYNQVHFPGRRWASLQIEHELYMLGHLIEAGISHHQATGSEELLRSARSAADLLVKDFLAASPVMVAGHEEIEIALIKLYRHTAEEAYLDLAEALLERRGRIRGFAWRLLKEFSSTARHALLVNRRRKRYLAENPGHSSFALPPGNPAHSRPQIRIWPRLLKSLLTGEYSQQHRPVRDQLQPVGHAVRYTYLQAALAMLYRERGDQSLLESLEASWDHMVRRRMYVTGGLGSLPLIEGFGRDYELDPAQAYAETCAALGCLFWNWEMTLITQDAKYADLFEWQLYNAASVGIGLDGRSYLYNNPLESLHGMRRESWFDVPCCPSNLSRVWASLGQYLASAAGTDIWVHQYLTSEIGLVQDQGLQLKIISGFPWGGDVKIDLALDQSRFAAIHLRIPSWTSRPVVLINGQEEQLDLPARPVLERTASGYDPRLAQYLRLERRWENGDQISIFFPMEIKLLRQHPRLRASAGKKVLTYGPIVYCLEGIDNPGIDIRSSQIAPESLGIDFRDDYFNGCNLVRGQTAGGDPITAIPYLLWANRDISPMTTMLNFTSEGKNS